VLGVADAGDRERCTEQGDLRGPDHGPRRGEQLELGALRDDPAVADDDEVIGDDRDLVKQV
jgi:hypothetical protein